MNKITEKNRELKDYIGTIITINSGYYMIGFSNPNNQPFIINLSTGQLASFCTESEIKSNFKNGTWTIVNEINLKRE